MEKGRRQWKLGDKRERQICSGVGLIWQSISPSLSWEERLYVIFRLPCVTQLGAHCHLALQLCLSITYFLKIIIPSKPHPNTSVNSVGNFSTSFYSVVEAHSNHSTTINTYLVWGSLEQGNFVLLNGELLNFLISFHSRYQDRICVIFGY